MTENPDPVVYNRDAWDREVDRGNEWTRAVGPEYMPGYFATRAVKSAAPHSP